MFLIKHHTLTYVFGLLLKQGGRECYLILYISKIGEEIGKATIQKHQKLLVCADFKGAQLEFFFLKQCCKNLELPIGGHIASLPHLFLLFS